MATTAELAGWAAGWNAELASPLARQRAADALEDTIACMVAGAGDVAAGKARKLIADWSNSGATVVGSERQAAAPFAAFSNATSAHALDYDDTVGHALTHPSAVLFPALLALAEDRNLSCRSLLSAWIVGLEIQVALGQAVNRKHYDKGWHATSTVGLIGAAGACARLLDLDPEQTAAALSLATSMTSGSKGQFGTMAKPLHAGLAAKAAVFAATLAAEGVTANPEPLDGEYGFLKLYCGDGWRPFAPILEKLGSPPAIEWLGLDTKPYPCCSSMHLALDAFGDLQAEHGFRAADIVEATATIARGPSLALISRPPRDEVEARFSLPYAAAALVSATRLRVSDFTAAGFRRDDIQALASRIQMKIWTEQQEAEGQSGSEVLITLRNGQRLSKLSTMVRGSLSRPLTAADREAKFEDCVRGLLPDDHYTSLRKALASADNLSTARQLMAPLRFAATIDSGERFLREATDRGSATANSQPAMAG